jgi:hypothetical protein
MTDDPRQRELEQEYLKYFPPVEQPRPPLVQRIVGTALFMILLLYLALIFFDIACGALWRLLE